jgi:hypothetical protein
MPSKRVTFRMPKRTNYTGAAGRAERSHLARWGKKLAARGWKVDASHPKGFSAFKKTGKATRIMSFEQVGGKYKLYAGLAGRKSNRRRTTIGSNFLRSGPRTRTSKQREASRRNLMKARSARRSRKGRGRR